MSHLPVRIENPAQGCGFTSLAHAKRYVKHGRAEWVKGVPFTIRFTNKTRNEASRPRFNYGIGFASLKSVKKIPVAGDPLRAFIGKRPEFPPIDFGEPIFLAHRYLPITNLLRERN